MPIYEYRCESCGHELDALQKIADAPLTDCPECGDAALKRLISAPAFRLKGSGWYETDFKSDKENKRNLAGEAAGKGEAGKKDGAGESAGKSDKATDKGGDSGGKSSASDTKSTAETKPGKSSKSGSQGKGSEAA